MERAPGRSSIAFYARPSTPRRCFELGIEALRKVWESCQDVDIFLFGTEALPRRIPFPCTNLGILDQEALARLFSGVDIGLVLSSTNCSLIPLEMMACECAVVDLRGESVEAVLTHEVNALLADPTPETIAQAILRLRALESSGDWDAYWSWHKHKSYERNHAARYAERKPPKPVYPALRNHLSLIG